MADNYECLKLSNQLCFPLYACAKEVVHLYKPFLDPLDLTYTQYITMMVLWEHRQIHVKDLGKLLFLDSGTLTPLLKKLESKGFITRTRDSHDERNLIVRITAAGEALRAEAVKVPSQVGSCIQLTGEEAQTLYTLLKKLLGQLEA